jgi:hypothetical protein
MIQALDVDGAKPWAIARIANKTKRCFNKIKPLRRAAARRQTARQFHGLRQTHRDGHPAEITAWP